ncbi:MAG: DinB family protein [Actinobacteria bacterium]|nr:DinB family protein [Actinomycetota bacterium]
MTPFLRAAIASLHGADASDVRCPECGFAWQLAGPEAETVIGDAATRYASHLADWDDRRAAPAGTWSPSAYVWHVVDVFRAWSERFRAAAEDPETTLVPWDQDRLAEVRGYDRLPLAGALWSLDRAAVDLAAAVEDLDHRTGFTHPDWGSGDVEDALRWIAHEVTHHEVDIARGVNGD